MKSDVHPKYQECAVTCSCGQVYNTRSTLCRDLSIEVCSECHPFYSGKQKIIDTAGRVEKFKDRFRRGGAKSNKEETAK
jgi:large subunit ribosomal protein L31